jgi:hypothetical protein
MNYNYNFFTVEKSVDENRIRLSEISSVDNTQSLVIIIMIVFWENPVLPVIRQICTLS